MSASSAPHASPRPALHPVLAFALDLLLVLLFVAIGRKSHQEDLAGTLTTALPFLLALVLAWLLPRVRRNPISLKSSGLIVWLMTALGGQVLRVIFGGTTELSFIVVTLLVTGLFLLGWRALARLLLARKNR